MAKMACPHCGGENVEGGSFCQTCGKALPAEDEGPAVGMDAARKRARWAAGVLLFVGGITLLFAVVGGLLIAGRTDVSERAVVELAVTVGAGLVFLVLGFWAFRDPLLASIVGLLLYVTATVVGFLEIVRRMRHGSPRQQVAASDQLVGVGIAALLIVALATGVYAGVRHNRILGRLQERGGRAAGSGVPPVVGWMVFVIVLAAMIAWGFVRR